MMSSFDLLSILGPFLVMFFMSPLYFVSKSKYFWFLVRFA